MSEINLSGLGVALITPFGEDNSIDYAALSQLVKFHLESATDYIVALGTTAESPTLSKQEKRSVIRFITEQTNHKIPVIAGVGGNSTADVAEELETGDFTGVSAILSVTPSYNKPPQEGLYRHYRTLSHASPLPLILYNVPGRTGVNMTAETTLRLSRDCSNIIAVKEASGDLRQIKAIIDGAPEGFSVISGDDSITADVIALGGTGVISVFANAFPREMAWLVRSALEGNATEARRKMNDDFGTLFRLMFEEGNPAGVKCLLHLMGMIRNRLRLPLVPVSEKTLREIETELVRLTREKPVQGG
ncbi:MAG: 4-hydroxy-tetrahydrodipicolinate synthase [Proteiniphilum sp.]|jgi:4-hydroxy-tetrahydrodipicolinate synthase|nr:4-hydroxy-tetrahydrodipicolinate synthase [Proteiniphilum sp.]